MQTLARKFYPAPLSCQCNPSAAEFGWSRTAISGAVSLGGVLAALVSPFIGSYLDARGPRLVLALAVLTTGITLMLLSQISSLLGFYLLYCIARMNWAGPYDLGIHGAVSNWFIEKRAWAASLAQLAQTIGLIVMPFVAFTLIADQGWRMGWLVIGGIVLAVGFLPGWLLVIRRPEDIGLLPDGVLRTPAGTSSSGSETPRPEEPSYTRAEALRTPAFWTLALFTALIYPVQAGMSLHQPAHLIERGLSPRDAAIAVSFFTLTSAITGFSYGFLSRWLSVKVALAAAGCILAASGRNHDGNDNPAFGAAGWCPVRLWHRRRARHPAGRLGGLFRASQFRGHSRRGTFDPGRSAGSGGPAVGHPARRHRYLYRVARVLSRLVSDGGICGLADAKATQGVIAEGV